VTIHSDVESVEDGAAKIFQSLLDLGYMNTEELKVITGKKMKANPLPAKGEKAEKAEKGAAKADKGAKARRGDEARPAAKVAKADKGAKARPATRAARVAKPAPSAKKPAKNKAR
jgi:adenylylsulfate kinase